MGRPARIDTAIAAALTLVSGAELVWRAPPAPPVVRAAGTVLVAALLVVPVAGWRSWPVTASVMIACVGPILLLTQVPIDGVPIAGSVALAVVSLGAGDRLSRRRALVA